MHVLKMKKECRVITNQSTWTRTNVVSKILNHNVTGGSFLDLKKNGIEIHSDGTVVATNVLALFLPVLTEII